jgi:hypothetical protein
MILEETEFLALCSVCLYPCRKTPVTHGIRIWVVTTIFPEVVRNIKIPHLLNKPAATELEADHANE